MGGEVDLARVRPVVVVGGGPRAVALALRLAPGEGGGPPGVVAAPGGWLADWARGGATPDAGGEPLRCSLPVVGGLGPGDPTELQDWAARRGREGEIFAGAPGYLGNPSRALAGDFLRRLARRCGGPGTLPLEVREAAVCGVERVDPGEAERLGVVAASGAGSGETLLRVAFEGGGSVITRALVVADSAPAPIQPSWAQRLREDAPPGVVATWDELRRAETWPDVRGQAVCVVGGGAAAARLALAAVEGGAASVAMAARRPLLARELECEVGWYFGKLRRDFLACSDPAERLRLARAARGQGTLPTARLARLRELADTQSPTRVLELKEVCEVSSAAWEGGGAVLGLTALFRGLGGLMEDATERRRFDRVWVAAGDSFDAARDPLLASLQALSPCSVVGGYPCLGPGLAWPGLPAFVMGRAALLAVGPGARTLFTAREEAEQVAQALGRLWGRGRVGLTTASAAAKALAGPMQAIRLSEDGGSGGGEPLDDALPWRPELERATLVDRHRLRDDFLPQEAHRQAIRNFSWIDDEYEVEVRVPLPGGIRPGRVRAHILEDGIELYALEEPGEGAPVAHHLHIPKLYKQVLVEKSRWRYSEKKARAYFYLRKYDNHAWPLLKG